ncbi:hypothetical protein COU95_03415 [Candidatus Shapirobacteria bacterium CG10_big_fil_rev_8_21_14_0_10_40_9]|uniref:Uncharacterized protein n=1 Tax=Candidatus Shapirobacteria bacterium CG10_big_fil_rev_8_21_14_0_10_40_9 TaxID=1974888 RepID=A0A2M8L2U8_9BACT|nr:MAG: hypothetical protein COU95_03415 [Candidatus Shapirobacteria bacterium CG10_big_fil_rev_8_21_14_0_10_40_9]
MLETDRSPEKGVSNDQLEPYCLSQIKAAPYTLKIIHSLDIVTKDPSLGAIKETDVYRLRRGLCLPCAAATCINKVKGERLIGDRDGSIKIGDFFKLVLPFHGAKGIVNSEIEKEFPKGWLVTTPEGDIYHHAIIAFAKALGVTGVAVRNFESVTEFLSILDKGGCFTVSLDNRFVLEQTLGNNPELVAYSPNPKHKPKILIGGKEGLGFRNFEEGRHAVAILEINEGKALIADSFVLPQMKSNLLLGLDISIIDKYLTFKTGGSTRGIIFSLNPRIDEFIKPRYLFPVVIPEEIVRAIRKNLR